VIKTMIVLIAGTALVGCGKPDAPPVPSAPPAASSTIGPPPGPRMQIALAHNPYSGDRVAIADGYQYYQQFNCSGCHGDHGGGGMGPSLRDSTWLYGGEDAQVFASIYQGRDRGMPSWGSRLSPEQIWKVVSYIKSMRTANEPDPPH
jgi:mono/diheme cytochrome c family protein